MFSKISQTISSISELMPIILVAFFASIGFGIITPTIDLDLDIHHFSSTYIGFVNIMWPIGFFVSTIVFSNLAQRFSVRTTVLASLALSATLVLFIWHYLENNWLFPIDFFIGFFYGIILLSIQVLLLRGGVKNKATLLAIFGIVIALARTIGSTIVGFINIDSIVPFLISSFCLWVGFFMVRSVKLPDNKSLETTPAKPEEKNNILSVLKTTPFLILLSFSLGACISPLNIFLPIYGTHIGLDTGSAALLFSIYLSGAMILSLPIGILGDKLGHSRILILCITVFILLCGLNYLISHNMLITRISLFAIGGMITSIGSLSLAYICKNHDGIILSSIIAAFTLAGKLGGIFSAVTTGEVITVFGYNILFFFLVIGGSIMLFSVILSRKDISLKHPFANEYQE